jgi:hypothetical protein
MTATIDPPVLSDTPEEPHRRRPLPPGYQAGPILDDWMLHIYADSLDDLEHVRCANENRLRSMTQVHGLTDEHPDVALLADTVDRMKKFEHESELNLRRRVRSHPLWHVMEKERGVGEKQVARLLAVIGDPVWHEQFQQHRTLRQLRAYCGLHVLEGSDGLGSAPKRQRGSQSNWNEDARKRLWLIADSIIRANMGKMADRPDRSKYALVYEGSRFTQYGEALHALPCVRCGPKGKPAEVGSELSDGHKKARAMRKVMVAILDDLWKEAFRQHGGVPD